MEGPEGGTTRRWSHARRGHCCRQACRVWTRHVGPTDGLWTDTPGTPADVVRRVTHVVAGQAGTVDADVEGHVAGCDWWNWRRRGRRFAGGGGTNLDNNLQTGSGAHT